MILTSCIENSSNSRKDIEQNKNLHQMSVDKPEPQINIDSLNERTVIEGVRLKYSSYPCIKNRIIGSTISSSVEITLAGLNGEISCDITSNGKVYKLTFRSNEKEEMEHEIFARAIANNYRINFSKFERHYDFLRATPEWDKSVIYQTIKNGNEYELIYHGSVPEKGEFRDVPIDGDIFSSKTEYKYVVYQKAENAYYTFTITNNALFLDGELLEDDKKLKSIENDF